MPAQPAAGGVAAKRGSVAKAVASHGQADDEGWKDDANQDSSWWQKDKAWQGKAWQGKAWQGQEKKSWDDQTWNDKTTAKGHHQKVQLIEDLKPDWQKKLEVLRDSGHKQECKICNQKSYNYKWAYWCEDRKKVVWDHLPGSIPCDNPTCARHRPTRQSLNADHWQQFEHDEQAYETEAAEAEQDDRKKRRRTEDQAPEEEENLEVKEEEDAETGSEAGSSSVMSQVTVVSPQNFTQEAFARWTNHLHKHFSDPEKFKLSKKINSSVLYTAGLE